MAQHVREAEICHRDRRFVECGDVCNKLQDLGVFRRQCGEGDGRLHVGGERNSFKNETDQLCQSNGKKQTRFIAKRYRSTAREKFKVSQANGFRLGCTGRTCITPSTTTPFWFDHVSLAWVFLPFFSFHLFPRIVDPVAMRAWVRDYRCCCQFDVAMVALAWVASCLRVTSSVSSTTTVKRVNSAFFFILMEIGLFAVLMIITPKT